MAKTLITFLGGSTGKTKKEPDYKPTTYCFPNGRERQASYFGYAYLEEYRREISQLLVFGTRTSFWYNLALESDESLAECLMSQAEKGEGITEDQLRQLEQSIANNRKLDVHLYAGPVGITSENGFDELINYAGLLQRIEPHNEIVVDFTHSFRSMPTLLLSAMQFQSAFAPNSLLDRVRLVYGEFNQHKPSTVHLLDNIWIGIRVARAARLFFDKYEGEELAAELDAFWPEGGDAIRVFSENVQMNFSRRLKGSLKKLGKALGNPPAQPAQWFGPVQERLKRLYDTLKEDDSVESILLRLSSLLAENQLYGQAFLALDEALLSLAIRESDKSDTCSWPEAKECRRQFLGKIKSGSLKKGLYRLHDIRNVIAHGGRMETGNQPEETGKLKNEFEKRYSEVETLLRQKIK